MEKNHIEDYINDLDCTASLSVSFANIGQGRYYCARRQVDVCWRKMLFYWFRQRAMHDASSLSCILTQCCTSLSDSTLFFLIADYIFADLFRRFYPIVYRITGNKNNGLLMQALV